MEAICCQRSPQVTGVDNQKLQVDEFLMSHTGAGFFPVFPVGRWDVAGM